MGTTKVHIGQGKSAQSDQNLKWSLVTIEYIEEQKVMISRPVCAGRSGSYVFAFGIKTLFSSLNNNCILEVISCLRLTWLSVKWMGQQFISHVPKLPFLP